MRRILAVGGCESAGHFSLLGYTTKPNYNECIHTVYVPQFNSQIFIDTTRRSLPVDVTKAVIREIESKTPFKVVSNREQADTELSGTLLMLSKNLLNRNQLNEIREAETVLTAAIVWKDLRTGEILSKPRKGALDLTTPGIPALEIPDIGGYLPVWRPDLAAGRRRLRQTDASPGHGHRPVHSGSRPIEFVGVSKVGQSIGDSNRLADGKAVVTPGILSAWLQPGGFVTAR